MNPRMPESESGALPLGDAPILWWREMDRTIEVSDNRFTVCPLWPLGYPSIFLVPRGGSDHRHEDFQSSALPTELPGQLATRKGLEPSTSSVTGWHSNHLNYRATGGGPSGFGTPDRPVMSRLLFQLAKGPITCDNK